MTSTQHLPEVTNVFGTTFAVGDRVRHFGHKGWWTGTVIEIIWHPNRAVRLRVNPDDPSQLGDREYYTLNPQAAARHGSPTYCAARDVGLTMGNFEHVSENGGAK